MATESPLIAIRKEAAVADDVTERSIRRRVARLRPDLGDEVATYVVARQCGVDLSRFGVSSEKIIRASELAGRLSQQPQEAAASKSEPKPAVSKRDRVIRVKLRGVELPLPAAMKRLAAADHVRAMEAYSILIVFENAIRDLIRRVLESRHGATWWDEAVPKKVNEQAKAWKAQEKEPWHQPRGDHPIYYLGFTEYLKIITAASNWPLFEPILVNQDMVKHVIGTSNLSRRTIAHMAPLSKDDFDQLVQNAKTFTRAIKQNEDKLP